MIKVTLEQVYDLYEAIKYEEEYYFVKSSSSYDEGKTFHYYLMNLEELIANIKQDYLVKYKGKYMSLHKFEREVVNEKRNKF